jgi:hypothetical protein
MEVNTTFSTDTPTSVYRHTQKLEITSKTDKQTKQAGMPLYHAVLMKMMMHLISSYHHPIYVSQQLPPLKLPN